MAAGFHFPDEQLIAEVRKYPCLYDPRDAEYKGTERRAAVWREISNSIGITASECEQRWRYLRDRYTRERKRRALLSSSGNSSKLGHWVLGEQMNFLRDFVKHRKYDKRARSSSVAGNEIGPSVKIIHVEAGTSELQRELKLERGHSSSEESNDAYSSRDPSDFPMVVIEENAPTHNGFHAELPESHRLTTNHYESAANRRSTARVSSDEEELFCLSLAQTMRRFSPLQRSLAKVRIVQLMHEIEFGST